MKRLLTILVFLFLCLTAEAQITQIRVWNGNGWNSGTGVCIAHRTRPPRAIVVTVRHIFDGTDGAIIEVNEVKIRRKRARLKALDSRYDLAIVEVPECEMTEYMVSRDIPEGIDVVVCGYGPHYSKQKDEGCFQGKLYGDGIRGKDSKHPIPGDSGGPVIAKRDDGVTCVMGIVTGYESDRPIVPYNHRDDVSRGEVLTKYVDSEKIYQFVKTQYGDCPTCPAWVVPEVRQPMIGIGIPVGPPRVVGVTPYRPPGYPVQNAPPQPSRPSEAIPGPQGPPGPEGPQGPAGPPGQDGRSVDQERIEESLAKWLDEHKDELRGPAGKDGRDGQNGRDGKDGERGLIGVPSEEEISKIVDMWVQRNDPKLRNFVKMIVEQELQAIPDAPTTDLSGLEKRLDALENRRQRFLIVDSKSGTVIDDETYAQGEPVVLDIQRLKKSTAASDAE